LAFGTLLAPRGDRGGIDLFVVWTLHEIEDAVAPHQIAGATRASSFDARARLTPSLFNRRSK
jgi:hypothetical protein